MSSLQISTIIHRLEQLADILDPVTLAEMLTQIIVEIAEPLPGNVEQLRSLAAAFSNAARDTAPVADDLRTIATAKLPGVWQDNTALTVSDVISDTSELIDLTQPAFSKVASAIDTYASTLSTLEARRADYVQQFHAAEHDGPDLHVFGISVPIDPLAWSGWLDSIRNLIFGSISLYNDLQVAADTLIGHFADAQADAKGSGQSTGTMLVDTTFLAAVTVDGTSLLGPAQLTKIRQIMAGMSPAEVSALNATLRAAGSQLAEAYILKALAAGHSLSQVETFAAEIRGKSSSWLISHLSLAGTPGMLSYDGTPLVQSTQTECGSASIVAARILADPMVAYSLTTGANGASLTGQQFAAKVAAMDAQVHDATNKIWPQDLGTSPWGVASGMNSGATAGAGYGVQWVDDTSPIDASGALAQAISEVDAGHPVPVLLAPTISGLVGGTSLHYVLITAHSGSQLSIYDPEGGTITQVPDSDFLTGNMQSIDAGAPHVNAIIVPGG